MNFQGAAVELLNNRLNLINMTIFGKENENENETKNINIFKDRLSNITNATMKIENDIPQIISCRELIIKLKPHLSKSKLSLSQTTEKLETAIAMKSELENIINMLITVENTSEFMNLPLSIEIMKYQQDLKRVENILLPLIELSKKQSEELDEFLTTYENTVSFAVIISYCY